MLFRSWPALASAQPDNWTTVVGPDLRFRLEMPAPVKKTEVNEKEKGQAGPRSSWSSKRDEEMFDFDYVDYDPKWFTGGEETPGRQDKVQHKLPPNIDIQAIPSDKTLSGMLERGEIDQGLHVGGPPDGERGPPDEDRAFHRFEAFESHLPASRAARPAVSGSSRNISMSWARYLTLVWPGMPWLWLRVQPQDLRQDLRPGESRQRPLICRVRSHADLVAPINPDTLTAEPPLSDH